jgi:protein tyrosine/serine phosphatase
MKLLHRSHKPLLLAAALMATACAWAAEGRRPERWATPLKRDGVPNLHRVDKGLYRGGQPTAQGMRELAKLGVKSVINLRAFHSDRDEIAGTDLGYVHFPMMAFHVDEEDVVRFLKAATDEKRRPVFVHCMHGADRTGVMCAAYRIAVQGWDKDAAIREMTEGGFGHHAIFANLAAFLREADFAAIRKKAGITPKGEDVKKSR